MSTRRPSVLFVAPEPLHRSLTGPARRTVKLAEAVAEHCAVTLAAPGPSVFPDGPFRTVETRPSDAADLAAATRGHDVAVVQTLPSPRQLVSVRRSARLLVVDLIAPLALEVAAVAADDRGRRAVVRWRVRQMIAHLQAADLVLCTNERQRDLLIGAALAAGLLDPGSPRPFHENVVVVPHGVDPELPPRAGRRVLREDGFASPEDRVAVWGGGIWSWLDPLTAIMAVERLRHSRPDLKLVFVGLDHPDPSQRRAHEPAAAAAIAYARERDLTEAVAFRPRWLPRDEYLEHLQDADVGISLHEPSLEGRYASRTRVLDYLVAGLPVVCSRGDTMSELVERHRLGVAVEASDVAGCASALDRITAGPRQVDARAVLEPLLWRNVARPLVAFCLADRAGRSASTRTVAAAAASGYPAFLHAVYRSEGAAVRRGAGLLRRRR